MQTAIFATDKTTFLDEYGINHLRVGGLERVTSYLMWFINSMFNQIGASIRL